MGILSGESNALAVQQSLYLLGMGGRVDDRSERSGFPQQTGTHRLQLFDLGHKVTGAIDLFHGVHQLGSLLDVLLVSKAGAHAGTLLHIDLMVVPYNGLYLGRVMMVRNSPFLMSFSKPNFIVDSSNCHLIVFCREMFLCRILSF